MTSSLDSSPSGISATAEAPLAALEPQQNGSHAHLDQLSKSRFTELGINKELYAQTGGARVRQHVNPLKKELQVPTGPLPWATTYADPTLPMVVDIGAGYGRFLLALSMEMPEHNFLGLEIRSPVIDRANRWAEALNLSDRVHFVLSNATVSLEHMLASYPGSIDLVTIQYPDPHFKKRHRKRRIVQRQLVEALAQLVMPRGRVLLQSDVLEVAEDMRDQFERFAGETFKLAQEHRGGDNGAVFHAMSAPVGPMESCGQGGPLVSDEELKVTPWAAGGWLRDNPVPVPTERELHALSQGLPVYRVLLERCSLAS